MLEAKAKDQGHKRKCFPKKKKKRSSQKFFRRSQKKKKKKVFTKIFQAISTTKRFLKNFSTAPQSFNYSKNSAVLKPRTGQFSRTWGLEASSPRKLACPRLEDSTIFWKVKILRSGWKIFWKAFFPRRSLEKFLWRPFFFFFFEIAWKIFVKTFFFFFGEHLRFVSLVLGLGLEAFLSLASRVSVLGKAVLGLGLEFFCVLGLGLEPCVLDSTSARGRPRGQGRPRGLHLC